MGKSSSRKKKSNSNASTTNPPHRHSNGNGILPSSSDPDFLKRAHELKEEGNRFFQSKDYPAALESYARALSLLPRGHPERAVFHSNRAACLMQVRPVDHSAVAAECSLALQSQPLFPRALFRRARARAALHRPDLALQDIRSLLSVDPSNPDALDLYSKLLNEQQHHNHDDVVDVKSTTTNITTLPSPAALGASAVRGVPISGLGPCLPARPVRKKSTSPPPLPPPLAKIEKVAPAVMVAPSPDVVRKPPDKEEEKKEKEKKKVVESRRMRPLKLVYDHDIRLAEMPERCGFRVLREVVGKRFPCSRAVLIKYRDEDGDLVTVTSTKELRLAEEGVDKGRKDGETLGVLRLHVVEVTAEQEPVLVDDEEEEMEEKPGEENDLACSSIENGSSLLQVLDKDQKAGEQAPPPKEKENEVEKVEKKECDHAECKEVEIDDWLYDFAQLFRQQVGVDPDAHLDLHELGMELCSEALEETMTSVEAQNLFELAAAKFQEVAALAFFNWGNVHMCAARKKIPLDESAPKDVMAAQLLAAYDWVRERYALAGEKYVEALRIKSDFYEGLLALGQQHFETAKLHWSFALASKVDLTTWDSSETIKLFDSAEEKMKSATEMWEKAEEQRMNELKDPGLCKKEELLKKRKKQGVGVDGRGELSAQEAVEQATMMRSQIHLFWGNMLFERSQIEYKLGVGDWKKNLDMSVERFNQAGASEADISVVLKNHASNGSGMGMECDEKKVTSTSNGASGIKANGEDKHVLEN